MGILEFENFSFTYAGKEETSIQNINLSVKEGDFLLICGASGSGKSTLLRQVKPALAPYGKHQGRILFDGEELDQIDARKSAARIGYVLQNPNQQVVTDKVWHELAFGMESLGERQETIRLRVAEMAAYFGIESMFYRNVNELSGGQKQLLSLASVMAMNPSVLILDEPTAQLDPIAASDFFGTLQKINQDMGITIIITEHRLQELFPIADQVVVMEQGSILIQDTPQKVGAYLAEQKHPMYQALPSPMQICLELTGSTAGVSNVREGRKWLKSYLQSKECRGISSGISYAEEKGKEAALECKEIRFRYDRNGREIVKGASLTVQQGEWFCLLGGNGAGKSTLLSIAAGLLPPYQGKVVLFGKELKKYPKQELYHGMVGMVPQDPQSLFVKSTVWEELQEMLPHQKAHRRSMDTERTQDAEQELTRLLQQMHLEHLQMQHPYDLSGGEQQRLAMAKVLLLHPKLLLLDEPTKGLDSSLKTELAGILLELKAEGITILAVSHDIEFCASYADRCGLFFDGTVAACETSNRFFAENIFYTTSANRMARQYFPDAITVEDVINCCRAAN